MGTYRMTVDEQRALYREELLLKTFIALLVCAAAFASRRHSWKRILLHACLFLVGFVVSYVALIVWILHNFI